MCQRLVKEKLTLNTNQAQLCASPPTHPFIGELSLSAWVCPCCFRDNQHLSQSVHKNEVCCFQPPLKKENTAHLLLCSKDCCCMQSPVCPAQGTSKSKRLHLQVYGTKRWISACPTHPPCFGPQCPCRYCSTAAIIFFCWGQIHARGCSRDAKHISVVPVRMRDTAAEQCHLFLWHLSPVACLGSPQDTAHAQQQCGAETHRQVLSGLPGQCNVPKLCFPTLLEERPCTGQPQAPPPQVKVLPAGREVSACWAYAHPSSCPALTNWAYHPPK